jgi:integrase
MPVTETKVRGNPITIEEAIAGRERAMVDKGSDPLYIRICGNTVRRVANASEWTLVSDITYASVSAALYAIREAGRTKKTRDNTLAAISELMEWAVKNGHAAENPCKLIDRVHSRGEIETDAPRAFRWEESERLEDTARRKEEANIASGRSTARRADLIRVLRYTGRRVGEWVPLVLAGKKDDAIRVRDVRLDTEPYPVFVVRPSVNKSRKKLVLPIHPALVPTLVTLVDGKHPEDYVFESQPDTETWDNDLSDAGILKTTPDGPATLHSLRKTFNTTLARFGVGPLERKMLMGHALHTDLTDGTYLDKAQVDIYAALCKLPGVPEGHRIPRQDEKNAQENLTCASSAGDTEPVPSSPTQTSRGYEPRPKAVGTAHSAATGRGLLPRETVSCADEGCSFDGVDSEGPSPSPAMPPEGLEPSTGFRRGEGAQVGAKVRLSFGRPERISRLSDVLADTSSLLREVERSEDPNRIRYMKSAAKAASAVAALIATIASATLIRSDYREEPSPRVITAHNEQGTPCLLDVSTGTDCSIGHGCNTRATVTACLICCDTNCNYAGFYQDCAKTCLSGPPAEVLPKIARAGDRLQQKTHANQDEMLQDVTLVEVGCTHPDELIREASRAVGRESPFVVVPPL